MVARFHSHLVSEETLVRVKEANWIPIVSPLKKVWLKCESHPGRLLSSKLLVEKEVFCLWVASSPPPQISWSAYFHSHGLSTDIILFNLRAPWMHSLRRQCILFITDFDQYRFCCRLPSTFSPPLCRTS